MLKNILQLHATISIFISTYDFKSTIFKRKNRCSFCRVMISTSAKKIVNKKIVYQLLRLSNVQLFLWLEKIQISFLNK